MGINQGDDEIPWQAFDIHDNQATCHDQGFSFNEMSGGYGAIMGGGPEEDYARCVDGWEKQAAA